MKNYEKALEINPKLWKAHVGKGNVYLKLEKENKAMEEYEKAIASHPKEGRIYCMRGRAYKGLKKIK